MLLLLLQQVHYTIFDQLEGIAQIGAMYQKYTQSAAVFECTKG